jgi:hypothetical protein
MNGRRYGNLLLLTLAVAFLAACGSKLTSGNLQKIHNDMTVVEVKSVLGEPTEEKTGGIGPLNGTSLIYRDGKNEVVVNFVNDKVVMKNGSFDH